MTPRSDGIAAPARPQFEAQSDLRSEISRRVEAHFAERGLDEKGGRHALAKTAVIFAWAIASYVALVFLARNALEAALPAVSLGLALAGIGFAVMHDGSHGASSHRGWINRVLAGTLDLLGGSSYLWHQKHDILHHTYTNVDGVDDDIDSSPFLRLSPDQKRRFYHRFQHLYMWLLLVFFIPKWLFSDDLKTWITGRYGTMRIPRPRGWDAVQLVMGKLVVFGWAFALPLSRHSPGTVAIGFLVVSTILGATLAIVFQLAHVVEGPAFHENPWGGKLSRPFYEHQIATTANFAPENRLLTWYVGGLNYQIEHHLFPRIAHRHYPEIAKITREVCRERGIPYHCNPTFLGAVRSHYRHLRNLATKD